jgi:uncharacterized delta-60 repeat protein
VLLVKLVLFWSTAAGLICAAPGDLDLTFEANINGSVSHIVAQPDGKLLIAGDFSAIDGLPRKRLARLNADGRLDASFDAGEGVMTGPSEFSARIHSIALQPDGKILVGGYFTAVNGVRRAHLARLNSDGSLDAAFYPRFNDVVATVAVQAEGKVLVGGFYNRLNETIREGTVRLNMDGTLDDNFTWPGGPFGLLVVQPDQKVIVGGSMRLNQDGTLDPTYNAAGPNFGVSAVSLQSDGKLMLGGSFQRLGGIARNHIGRLNADGSLDSTFDPGVGPNWFVEALAVQSDGRVIIGGNFTEINGIARNRLARLNADGGVDMTFDSGMGPNDGVRCILLEAGGKVLVGGFFTRFNGVAKAYLARLVAGSMDVALPPQIRNQPASRTVSEGSDASFAVSVFGQDEIQYQWYFRGQQLQGATNSNLIIIRAGRTNAGIYSVQIRNAVGVVESGLAVLRVVPPPAPQRGPSGKVDLSFDPGSQLDGGIADIILTPENKIFIGGGFSTVPGAMRQSVAKLNADGSVDPAFNPRSAIENAVAIARQSDGKLLVAMEKRVVRLDVDGTLDSSFSSPFHYSIFSMALQSDGKVLLAGSLFPSGQTNVARFDANGRLDATFRSPDLFGADIIVAEGTGKILLGGRFSKVNGVARNSIARLNADGSLDTTFEPPAPEAGVTNSHITILLPQPDGKVLAAGDLDQRNDERVIRLNANGSLDVTFSPVIGRRADYTEQFSSLALQPDGKILVGSSVYFQYEPIPALLARFNVDGSADGTFNPTAVQGSGGIGEIAVADDGAILVSGAKNIFKDGGVRFVPFLMRLDGSGNVDSTFHFGAGPDNSVNRLARQSDGKILLAGDFGRVHGISPNRVARLHPDGRLDTTFNGGTGPDDSVRALAIQMDGRILIGGKFEMVDGVVRKAIARLNQDGSLDTNFSPIINFQFGHISSIAVLPDGKILAGGFSFDLQNHAVLQRFNPNGTLDGAFQALPEIGSISRILLRPDGKIIIAGMGIERRNADGSRDPLFDPEMRRRSDNVYDMALQTDGKVLVAGYNYNLLEETSNIVRLNSDGTLDLTFTPTSVAPNRVASVLIQPDGKVLIAGFFLHVNGVSRNSVARLYPDGNVDPSYDAGIGPEIGKDMIGSIETMLSSEGGVFLGGTFSSLDRVPSAFVVRLLADSAVAAPLLSVGKSGDYNVLTWTNSAFSLQAAPFVSGPYNSIPEATSPYTNVTSGAQQFFRLKTE